MFTMPTFMNDLTHVDPQERQLGEAFAHWLDAVASLAIRYEQGAFDSYCPRTYWRGQARAWVLSPGMHRRIAGMSQAPLDDQAVVETTDHLLAGARAVGLYPPTVSALGDLQLLAYLQHQGAATPLLDFSTDFLTALAMACFDATSDEHDGVLLCYRYRPCNASYVPAFTHVTPTVAFGGGGDGNVALFHAPYLTARQRIQRGVFIFSEVVTDNPNATVAVPISDHSDAIATYYHEHRSVGPSMLREHPVEPGQCAAIVVPREHKIAIRGWLTSQHQLNDTYVYPEALALDVHRQYIGENAATSPLGSNFGRKLF
ncbi:FRG domain-containing protein [Mycobacterium sp. TNTM28]|uniref:FRG domain-containing protein n=1 Tax=[Mycobacterium] fortunisiensis TaxID=2600579 RepID=A0ABS6KL10_9MYCO|nr:FRG domain-containing protein [[Mycobacterium] fortunisiensis]MBU9764292.1 FRG domain-containing protein [[Mycobacterium] fortunisiensis]